MRIKTIACTTVFLCSSGLMFGQFADPSQQTQQNQQQMQQQHPAAGTAGMSNPMDAQNNASSAPGVTGQQMQDKIFLRKAAEDGMAEVQFGKLAADKAVDPEVKALGAKMVADHTDLNNQLQPFLDQDGVMVPRKMDKKMQEQYDKLSALSGEEFDKAYLQAMLQDHLQDGREFRQEAIATNDGPLKATLDKGSLVIRQHLMATAKLAQAHGIELPRRGGPGGPGGGAPPASATATPPHQ